MRVKEVVREIHLKTHKNEVHGGIKFLRDSCDNEANGVQTLKVHKTLDHS